MAENGLIENVEAKNILEVRNLHYIYSDGTQALKALSLGIKQGKTTAVLGSNGAGKSTLLENQRCCFPLTASISLQAAKFYSRACRWIIQ